MAVTVTALANSPGSSGNGGSGGTGGSPTQDIGFASAVPLSFSGVSYMPPQTVSAVLNFTPAAGAVKNALVYLPLTANGTNVPTFPGFLEWGGSQGWDNRNGILNIVQFFYDGFFSWYSITQAATATPVTPPATAPLTMSAPTATPADASAVVAWALPGNGGAAITSITVVPYVGATAQTPQNFAAAATSGTVSGLTNGTAYTFRVYASNSVGAGTASASSNSITPSSVAATRLASLVKLTESGTGPYSYTGDGTGTFLTEPFGGTSTTKLASGVDGSFRFAVGALSTSGGTSEVMLAINTSQTLAAWQALPYVLHTKYSTARYTPFAAGTALTPAAVVVPVSGDIMQLRRTGSTLVAEVSKNGGTSFTTIYTWTGVSTGDLYFQVLASGVAQANNLSSSGLA